MNFSRFLYMFFCFSSFNNGAKLSLYAGLFGYSIVVSLLRIDPKLGVSVISMKFTPSYITRFYQHPLYHSQEAGVQWRVAATYSSQCPLLVFCDPSSLPWVKFNEVQILIAVAEHRLV